MGTRGVGSGLVDMVWIPDGSFQMGSPTTEPNRASDETQHLAAVSGFYMGKYWEYACRGDYPNKASETVTMPFGPGDGSKITGDMANFDSHYPYALPGGQYSDAAGTGKIGMTTTVGSYSQNNYGLYDMHGNVYEWCWDWRDNYPGVGLTDYLGPVSGTYRVVRGGMWNDDGQSLRSAARFSFYPYNWGSLIGFRVVSP